MLPNELVKIYEPSRNSALNYFRNKIDESMIVEISEADYGTDASQHFSTLQENF